MKITRKHITILKALVAGEEPSLEKVIVDILMELYVVKAVTRQNKEWRITPKGRHLVFKWDIKNKVPVKIQPEWTIKIAILTICGLESHIGTLFHKGKPVDQTQAWSESGCRTQLGLIKQKHELRLKRKTA